MSKRALDASKRYGRQVDLVEAARQIIEEQKQNGKDVSDIMEGRYLIPAFPQKISENFFEFKKCLIVTDDQQIQIMEWGLIPGWIRVRSDSREDITEAYIKAIDWRQKTMNARCETLFEKKTFSEPVAKRRCIIPSTGYFEYHHNTYCGTTPYFLHMRNEEIFSMAGIWNKWINPITKREIQTFSLITTAANSLAAKIHNGGNNAGRMPLILSPEDEETWLNPSLTEDEVKALLKTPSDANMEAYQVSPKFRLMDPHDPLIIEKVA
jgi:Uncharacterized conserved protein